jgi:hypothetical protein
MNLRKKRAKSEQRKEKKVSQKQTEPWDQQNLEAAPKVRFEATIHASRKAGARSIDHLDIDRVPGPKGQLRALVTADECVQLLDLGFEVRLHHAHPVRPLDPSLIATDESVRRWLDEKLRNIIRPARPKEPKRGKRT